MPDSLLAIRPRDIAELEVAIRWLADGIRNAGVAPADCEGDLGAKIAESLPSGIPPATGQQELGQDELAIELLLPRDIHDAILSRWTRPARFCRSLPAASLKGESLPDQIHIVIAESEKSGQLDWNSYDRWRQERTGEDRAVRQAGSPSHSDK
jgi:hypothetical protein